MKRIVFLTVIQILLLASPAAAQGWGWSETGPWGRGWRERDYGYPGPYGDYRAPPQRYDSPYAPRRYEAPYEPRRRSSWDRDDGGEPMPKLADGGPRPPIQPIPPQRIEFWGRYAPGTIIIDTAGRQLLLTEGGGSALRYPISVGREGFSWTGEEKISRIAEWPDWHPPAEMRERDPRLPEKMTGGLKNPLGAKALYLGNTLYRIHGTNDAKSIGRASSSGCFRMLNGHVIDLAERVAVGTKVVVVSSLRVAGR
ncbi:MAG: L,D-transpeptidase [Hyphomicrobiaceae bacterium]